jgi:hypothetical protein
VTLATALLSCRDLSAAPTILVSSTAALCISTLCNGAALPSVKVGFAAAPGWLRNPPALIDSCCALPCSLHAQQLPWVLLQRSWCCETLTAAQHLTRRPAGAAAATQSRPHAMVESKRWHRSCPIPCSDRQQQAQLVQSSCQPCCRQRSFLYCQACAWLHMQAWLWPR